VGQGLENVADVLPRRYREVLDAVDRIERAGARDLARRWRSEAIGRYSRAWDASTLQKMNDLLARMRSFETVQESRAERAA
jgi:hypothetical protein